MSAFNTLIAEIVCPACGNKCQVRIQFKFGNTWQLKYRVGDIITWGGNDTGSPNLGQVKVYGIIESSICPFCKKNAIPEEYDIFVANNKITRVTPLVEIQDYLNGNSEFVTL